jgi:hypothetical protein
MRTLTQETRHVQNPALGAVLLWRFVCGYTGQHKTHEFPPLQQLFIVLPIIFHRETFEILRGTNRPSGLHGFADKFSRAAVGKSDVLIGIQSRAVLWRALTLESLNLSIATRLLTVSRTDATAIPLTTTSSSGVPQTIKPLMTNSEKLGEWCSDLSLFEVGTILKVGF